MTGPAPAPRDIPAPPTRDAACSGLEAGTHLVAHALCVKQIASVPELVALTTMEVGTVEGHLALLESAGWAVLRARHELWQLTPDGLKLHGHWLADERAQGPGVATVRQTYGDFLPLNAVLKEQCGKWQLRDGQPNDHDDTAYDTAVVDELGETDGRVAEILSVMSAALPRLGGYRSRLGAALSRIRQGDPDAFTGVLSESYHDVWMELHQDLIVTLGIDRRVEGSA